MKKIAWMGLLFVIIFTLVGKSGSYSYFKDVEKSQGNIFQAGTWKIDQTITFDNPGDKTFGNVPFVLSASASSGLPVTLSVVSGPATWDGSNLTLTGAGTVTIRASQVGNDSYNAASDVEQTFNVAKATPTITWANPVDITAGTALDDTQLNATASVDGSFLYAPAAGTVLDVGAGQTLSVEFTPTDTANYNNTSATVTINVNAAPVVLNSIAITTPATKLVYTVGDPLDITGLVVTGTYSDGSSKVETITTANVTGFNSSTAVTGQVLTITVDGKTVTYTVTINAVVPPEVTLSSIAITTPATKLVYTVGDPLDITGLVVTGTYSDGSSKVETITTANVTGFNSSTAVTGQVLTITVDGKTVTYTVDVVN